MARTIAHDANNAHAKRASIKRAYFTGNNGPHSGTGTEGVQLLGTASAPLSLAVELCLHTQTALESQLIHFRASRRRQRTCVAGSVIHSFDQHRVLGRCFSSSWGYLPGKGALTQRAAASDANVIASSTLRLALYRTKSAVEKMSPTPVGLRFGLATTGTRSRLSDH